MELGEVLLVVLSSVIVPAMAAQEYPEGYYPFQRDLEKKPPSVRKPPYTQTEEICPGILEDPEEVSMSLDNLCGDLNSGLLPRNPLGQNVLGASYPFELIKNQTLDLFSRTLPVLKEDKTLPKVARFVSSNPPLRERFRVVKRPVRSTNEESGKATFNIFRDRVSSRDSRSYISDSMWDGLLKGIFNGLSLDHETAKQIITSLELDQRQAAGRGVTSFCKNNWGLFCLLYNTMTGQEQQRNQQRMQPIASQRMDEFPTSNSIEEGPEAPLTPCPSAVEYVTPVFARNYQGVWRYVVQIPYEGYFTQTVEITQCMHETCHYLSGSCLASPRWVSLLVAEIFYPDAVFPNTPSKPNFNRGSVKPLRQRPNFQRRAGTLQAPAPRYCDGVDQIGCFQVRLYYDWFLVPGACKCWKRNSVSAAFGL